ncbi:MAG: YqiA/YcfP family alpha/beta fold hydrolase [Pelistega sp.]|nr:YqiA/YcfP family alpha/beta fold hydrolase [Pelistega sp.]
MILYLHGFRSSPQSAKAQIVAHALQARGQGDLFVAPQLPVAPRDAIALCLDLAKQAQGELCIMGSSLGGYYATYLAQVLDCRAVLINPSIYAARDLSTQLDVRTTFYSDEPFHFKAEHVKQLAELFIPQLNKPERYLLLAGKRDEVLDWQEMQARYLGAQQIIVDDQDHAFAAIETYLPEVFEFIFKLGNNA